MQFIQNIAQGGFGRVELVSYQGTHYAKKIFSPAFDAPDEVREKMKRRFIRECMIQSNLDSPSFMKIVMSDLTGEQPWYLMPLAEKTMQSAIREKDYSEINSGLADILNALEELHALGFVHRDLKPQNVLKHEGHWKLADFGLILPPPSDTTKLTSIHSSWATEDYCAPEQRSDFGHVNHTADIYAFGCILHDIYGTTYRIPYSRHTAPGDIGAIIEKCTEVKPERRFQNVQSLRSALSKINESAVPAASDDALSWASWLASPNDWDHEKLHKLARHLSKDLSKSDLNRIFKSITDEAIIKLSTIDHDDWKFICIKYCEWIQTSNFTFEYCDVLGKRLEMAFNNGDLEIKALTALTAAKLAHDHNRWFVMDIVLSMCSHNLADNIAKRIAIEITAMEFEEYFRCCANNIGKSKNDYHKIIGDIVYE